MPGKWVRDLDIDGAARAIPELASNVTVARVAGLSNAAALLDL